MSPSIVSVGLATAQGGAAEILAGGEPQPPAPLPWPPDRRTSSTVCRPALGIDPRLAGKERCRALARRAVAECCGDAPPPTGTPLVVASCNGAAGSFEAGGWSRAFDVASGFSVPPWDGVRLPVVSAACASGLHALFLACRLLDAGAEEVVVLAADVLSAASHDNFEVLRILSPNAQPPWQPRTEGFLAGEAAVAIRLRRDGPGPYLTGPVLSHDLDGAGGLDRTLSALAADGVELILGQGTGLMDVDAVELAALRRAVPDAAVPLTTPLFHFGHTLGASGLLSLALAFLARERPLAALALPASRAPDGRRLADRPVDAGGDVLVVCRALGGACAACVLGDEDRELLPPPVDRWAEPVAPGPLHHPFLRRLAAEALDHRPETPPELLVVRLAEPLAPPERAVLGGRLLPSAVLEITPGFTALLVARAWGYAGPTLCLVGAREPAPFSPILSGGNVIYISPAIRPEGHHVDWNR